MPDLIESDLRTRYESMTSLELRAFLAPMQRNGMAELALEVARSVLAERGEPASPSPCPGCANVIDSLEEGRIEGQLTTWFRPDVSGGRTAMLKPRTARSGARCPSCGMIFLLAPETFAAASAPPRDAEERAGRPPCPNCVLPLDVEAGHCETSQGLWRHLENLREICWGIFDYDLSPVLASLGRQETRFHPSGGGADSTLTRPGKPRRAGRCQRCGLSMVAGE